jgi:hypothetical protein
LTLFNLWDFFRIDVWGFFKQKFNELLMLFLIIMFSSMAYRAFHVGNKEIANFAIDHAKLFAGALLTLLTSAVHGMITGNKPNDPPPPTIMAPPSPEAPQIGVGN